VIPARSSRRRCVATAGLLALTLGFSGCLGSGDDSSSKEKAQTTETTSTSGGAEVPKPTGKDHASSQAKKSGTHSGSRKAAGNGKAQPIPKSAPAFVGFSTRTVSGAEASKVGAKPGAWSLSLGTASYNLNHPGGIVIGTIKVSGHRMTFGPPPHRAKVTKTNPCGGSVGVYHWTMHGSRLTFTKDRDGCRIRTALSGVWAYRTKR
jgi:hypothetical protein